MKRPMVEVVRLRHAGVKIGLETLLPCGMTRGLLLCPRLSGAAEGQYGLNSGFDWGFRSENYGVVRKRRGRQGRQKDGGNRVKRRRGRSPLPPEWYLVPRPDEHPR